MIPVCPKCDTGLFILNYKSVEVDYCERCRGVWLDAGELEQISGRWSDDFQNQAGSPTRHLCPRCDQQLLEVTGPGNVLLDRCPRNHGLWFDADELEQLLAACDVPRLKEIFGKPN